MVFVGHERELAVLTAALKASRSQPGQFSFVIGGAGRGKSMLVHEFARRAQAADPELLAVYGYGHAHIGRGEPYLPFREALSMLTGEMQANWAGGLLTCWQAQRLWQSMPLTVRKSSST